MIKIDKLKASLIEDEYFERIRVVNRRTGTCSMKKYLNKNLRQIILGSNLDLIITDFEKIFRKEIKQYEIYQGKDRKKNTSFGKFQTYMENQYKSFFKQEYKREKNGIWLSKQLKVNTCPYCNRHYTFIIENINSSESFRPQFDHFYPKSRYPYLALSLYNLIPCCADCNQKKGEKIIDYYPYDDEFGDKCKFEIDYANYISGGSIKGKFHTENQNISVFKLEELYNGHSDYIEEIIEKAYAYNADYFKGLFDSFLSIGKSPSEINRLIFGNYIDVSEHKKRPLSKLTKDILDQIGLKEYEL